MEHSPSREANSPRLLCNPKVNYRVHKSTPLNCILIQMNPDHTVILIYHLRPGHQSCLHFHSYFLTEILYTYLIYPMRDTQPIHLIPLYLITVLMLVQGMKLISCYFLPTNKCPLQHPLLKHPLSTWRPQIPAVPTRPSLSLCLVV
jgi:hypothetical protein